MKRSIRWIYHIGCKHCDASDKVSMSDGTEWMLELAIFLASSKPPMNKPCNRFRKYKHEVFIKEKMIEFE
jgi:hypothetical protein